VSKSESGADFQFDFGISDYESALNLVNVIMDLKSPETFLTFFRQDLIFSLHQQQQLNRSLILLQTGKDYGEEIKKMFNPVSSYSAFLESKKEVKRCKLERKEMCTD
jgi:hypothetical protein